MVSDRTTCLAIIPARSGSKGLPGKNVLPLGGLPLLAHSIRCARAFCPDMDLVVSTDDQSTAQIARQQGVEVPFLRPAELATDSTPTIPVIQHALLEMEKRRGRRYESVLLLEPTSPLRLPDDLRRAFELLASDAEAVGVLSCSQPSFNPYWVGVVERDGYVVPVFPQYASMTRRQDVPPFYRINGLLYLWRRDFAADAPSNWSARGHRMIEVPEMRSISIDDLLEFRMAEYLLATGAVQLPWLAESASSQRSA